MTRGRATWMTMLLFCLLAATVSAKPLASPGDHASVTIAITVNIIPVVTTMEEATASALASGRTTLGKSCASAFGEGIQGSVAPRFRVTADHYYDCDVHAACNDDVSRNTTRVRMIPT